MIHTHSRHTHRDTHSTHTLDTHTADTHTYTHSRHTQDKHTHKQQTHTHIHTQQTHTETHRKGPPQHLGVWEAEAQRLLPGWVSEGSSAPNLELASLKKDRLADWPTAV